MRLSDMTFDTVMTAVVLSGITGRLADQVTRDLTTDTYWNDPKCAGRLIRAHGGDHIRFFDALPEVDWGEPCVATV